MKIRIGDITLEQFDKICHDSPSCYDCPLLRQGRCIGDEYDLVIEIPDKYFEKDAVIRRTRQTFESDHRHQNKN